MEADIKWLDDPETFRVNQLPAHSDHHYYGDYREWQTHSSRFIQSLNGQWQFKFSANPQERPVDFYAVDYDTSDFDEITVPSEIELSDYAQNNYINTLMPWEGKVYRRPAYTVNPNDAQEGSFSEGKDNTVGSYIRHFDLDPALRGKEIRICFEGVERSMYLWLNGHFIGYAEDSFTPSEFDLTPYIQDEDNVIAVRVYKHSTASWIEDQDMFRFSGIFRNVELKAAPVTHVEDLTIKPRVNDDFQTGTFNFSAKLSGEQAGSVHILVRDAASNAVVDETLPTEDEIELNEIAVNDLHLWDNHHPYLYQLLVEVRDAAGQLVELVPYQFGFRRIEISPDHVVLLNGQRLIINGVNRHEWDARGGRSVTLADMHSDIQTFKDNNINAVRTCHYPDQIPWYYLCDQNGIYMMAENNLESHATWQKMGAIEPSYNVPGSVPQWKEVVVDRARTNYETFKNHPAILFWSLGNESFAGDNMVAMQQFYKDHDATRLVHYEGVCHTRNYEHQIPSLDPANYLPKGDCKDYRPELSDVESWMYLPPHQVEEYLQNNPDKPFMECEYMHDMGNSDGGMGSYIKLLDKYPQYFGGFIWDFIDQALIVHDPISGQDVMRYGGDFDDRHSDYEFSGDGLMFADRTPKPAMQEVKYYYGLHK